MNFKRFAENVRLGKMTDDASSLIIKSLLHELYEDAAHREILGRELFRLRRFKGLNGKLPDQYRVPEHLGVYERVGYLNATNDLPKNNL